MSAEMTDQTTGPHQPWEAKRNVSSSFALWQQASEWLAAPIGHVRHVYFGNKESQTPSND